MDRIMDNRTLRIIPLGGLGEIGKNMMLLEWQDHILVIDAGVMFPQNDMWGIDLVIPDFGYLSEKQSHVQGIIITHGHEDHTGGLPYLLREVQAPIFATKLTLGLTRVKLREHGMLAQAQLHRVEAGDAVDLGPFAIEFFATNHSIPGGLGLAISTPQGVVVHSGDFKIDHTPVDGRPADLSMLAELGNRGVRVLLSDSTNSESPGFTPSERVIDQALDEVFTSAPGRIIVTTFASLISRIQQVVNAAQRHNRKVAVTGRSMEDNIAIAQELSYLTIPGEIIVPLSDVDRLHPRQVVIIATGSQGEPSAALARMARGQHYQIEIMQGDTVVISAHAVPGNEEFVHDTINRLFQRGANVIYDRIAPVHVSGHASQEEQKLLIRLVRPEYFVPIHGELRHLRLHARLAQKAGIAPERTLVVENGYVLEFDERCGRIAERIPGGYVFVDGSGVGDVGPSVMRDREILGQGGVVVVVVRIDAWSHRLRGRPEIRSRGFVFAPESEELLTGASEEVERALQNSAGLHWSRRGTESRVRDVLQHYFYRRIQRRPMVIPIVVEV
jgi:ribonuclease J